MNSHAAAHTRPDPVLRRAFRVDRQRPLAQPDGGADRGAVLESPLLRGVVGGPGADGLGLRRRTDGFRDPVCAAGLARQRRRPADAVRVPALRLVPSSGADPGCSQASDDGRNQDMGLLAPAGQWRPGRRAAVRKFPDLGGGWTHFHEPPRAAPRAGASAVTEERCRRGGCRPGGVRALRAVPPPLADRHSRDGLGRAGGGHGTFSGTGPADDGRPGTSLHPTDSVKVFP